MNEEKTCAVQEIHLLGFRELLEYQSRVQIAGHRRKCRKTLSDDNKYGTFVLSVMAWGLNRVPTATA